MMLSQLLFWGLLIAGVIYLVRNLAKPSTIGPVVTAEQILAERYAHGEIDDEEYRRRLGALRHG